MQTGLITVLSCVVYLTVGVSAEDEIKRGTYPFMAFIYYQDETILSLSGDRFLQGAVLVRSSFLISSSPESTISNEPLSKTLLARLGATIIDAKFTLNEDEDEQEQEVIQITRPSEHNSTIWWLTDICLLKTLQPIATTSSVHFTQLSTKQEPIDKVCHILVFKKKSGTDVRLLTRLFVEVLPASTDNCGVKFVEKTMTCAADQPTSDETQLSNDFCRGNNGGPLICDTDVIALQTYINGDCKPPHLYQLLSPRKRFLDCGIDEKCDNKERCQDVCTVIQKDAAAVSPTRDSSVLTSTEPSTESMTSVSPSPEPTTLAETTKTVERTESEETDTMPTPSSVASETILSTDTTLSVTPTKSWPHQRDGRKKNDEEADEPSRPISVEAQSQSIVEEEPKKAISRTKTTTNIAYGLVVFQNLVYSSFLLCICLL